MLMTCEVGRNGINLSECCVLTSHLIAFSEAQLNFFLSAYEFMQHILSSDMSNCSISEASLVSRNLFCVTKFWN